MGAGRFNDRHWLGAGSLLLPVLLAACASNPSAAPTSPRTGADTSYHAADQGDVAHYELALGQVSSGAVAQDRPPPVYPPSLLDLRLPSREVSARLFVDTQGKVSEVRIEGEAQADAQQRLFDAAVRAAALQWTFAPLTVSQWAADANGNSHVVSSEARPFSVDLVFRFAWKDGRPVTGVDAAVPTGRPPALRHSDD
ncbi:hypothetical protein [Dyella sp. C9]|uniref:hypothetical protein n=1 Tax=Dyella sp. C9 TaxID=2202154 RepID=UPI0018E538BF|nr:hypothetical protein [Dyella sp. C9]